MKTAVDKETCIGCGACYARAPRVYRSDKEKLADVIVEGLEMVVLHDMTYVVIPEDLEDMVRRACADCPTESIRVEE